MTLLAEGSAVIDVHRGQYLIGAGTSARVLPWRGNALLERMFEGAVSVIPGLAEGPLRVTVETHDEAPPLDLDDWEVVEEVSQFSDRGSVVIAELMGEVPDGLPQLELPPNSWVRIRGHARGRDEAHARDRLSPDEEPIEEHLLQMWPGPQAEDVCHRLSDWQGEVWRSQVRPRGVGALASARADIFVRKAQYWLRDGDLTQREPPTGPHALLNVFVGVVTVSTGIRDGQLGLRVETYENAPPLEIEGWEEVTEVSQFSPSGRARVFAPWEAPVEELPELQLSPESCFRIRCHVRNRDWAAAYGHRVPQAIEQHLVQMWPAPEAEDICHRFARLVGQGRRSGMRP